jgi:hypothetical protein
MNSGCVVVAFKPSDCFINADDITTLATPLSVQLLPRLETAIIVAYNRAAADRLVVFVGLAEYMENVNGKISFTPKFWEKVYNFRPKSLYAISKNDGIQDDVEMLIDQDVAKILEEYLGVKVG